MKLRTKVHRNFKIEAKLDALLRRRAKKTSISQTRIIELALRDFFAVKR